MSDLNQSLEQKLNEIASLLVKEMMDRANSEISLSMDSSSQVSNQGNYELLDVDEVAQFLKVKKRTIYEWVRTKKIPYRPVGDLLRFNRSEIISWLENSQKS